MRITVLSDRIFLTLSPVIMGVAEDALYFAFNPNQLGVLVQWWV